MGLQYLNFELAASEGDTALQDANNIASTITANSFCIDLNLGDGTDFKRVCNKYNARIPKNV
jgi:hypothetical protein